MPKQPIRRARQERFIPWEKVDLSSDICRSFLAAAAASVAQQMLNAQSTPNAELVAGDGPHACATDRAGAR